MDAKFFEPVFFTWKPRFNDTVIVSIKSVYLSVVLSFFVNVLFSQVTVQITCSEPAATVCPGSCVTLQGEVNGTSFDYVLSQIGYNPYPYDQGTDAALNIDDSYSAIINLPFTFDYYGNTYTQCVIGGNGLISFDTSYANDNCTWPISNTWPSPVGNVLNAIACPWQDIDNGVGGEIKYNTYGTAPNRVFVVSFNQIPYFDCNQLIFTGQICLYETSSIIETQIAQKDSCNAWNGGAAIHGIQDSVGLRAMVVPGRNFPAQWTCSNDAWRWTPQVNFPDSIAWMQGNTLIGTGSSITVCPTAETEYTALVTFTDSFGVPVFQIEDSMMVHVIPFSIPAMSDMTLNAGDSVQFDATIPLQTTLLVSYNTPTPIPIHDTINIPILVSGSNQPAFQPGDLLSVCLTISATITGQVSIYLISPTGQQVMLSTGNGGFGNSGFNNTCFSENAVPIITQYVFTPIPANIVVRPEQPNGFANFVGGPINGEWTLQVSPNNGTATFQSVALTFVNLDSIAYTWTPGNGLSDPTIGNPVATAQLTDITYTLVATNAYGCADTAEVTIFVGGPNLLVADAEAADPDGGAGIVVAQLANNAHQVQYAGENAMTAVSIPNGHAPEFRLFPNPANGRVTLEFLDVSDGSLRVEILAADGRVVLSHPWSSTNDKSMSLDVSALPVGIYVVRVLGSEGQCMRRLSVGK